MRIPHIINSNTIIAYTPSAETEDLIGEDERQIIAENFEWNKDELPPLTDFCVQALEKNFEKNPQLDELPCEGRDYLLEILSVDLPLESAIPNIHHEYYWERRYKAKFGLIKRRKPEFWTWKSIYVERHIQEVLEQAQPQYDDEQNMDDLLELCAPYVKRVIVTQLQSWKPPLTMDKEDIPEVYPIDHINLTYIFRKIPSIEEFDLMYGMNDVFEDFSWNMFKVSVADCQKLGKGLLELKQLKILRIHRSKLFYEHCQALSQNLIKNKTLCELDLSNCDIGDQGALCVAKVLGVHPTLQKLNLSNNHIEQIGAEGIGFTLLEQTCAQLTTLNLRLNPLRRDGTMGILRGVVRCSIPKELCLSGCQFDGDIPERISQVVHLSASLRSLDISNNWLGSDGGEKLVEALSNNRVLEKLDVRETDITPEQERKIKSLLARNLSGGAQTEEQSETTTAIQSEDDENEKAQEGSHHEAGQESSANSIQKE